jgi:hypothetical protein
MLDPVSITSGVFASVIGSKTKEVLEEMIERHGPGITQLLKENNALLVRILDQQSIDDNSDLVEPIMFQADATPNFAGQYWSMPEYKRNHVMVLLGNGVVLNYWVPGMPILQYTMTRAGWLLLDLPPQTKLNTTVASPSFVRWSNYANTGQIL